MNTGYFQRLLTDTVFMRVVVAESGVLAVLGFTAILYFGTSHTGFMLCLLCFVWCQFVQVCVRAGKVYQALTLGLRKPFHMFQTNSSSFCRW